MKYLIKNILTVLFVVALWALTFIYLLSPAVYGILSNKRLVEEYEKLLMSNYIQRRALVKLKRDFERQESVINELYDKALVSEENDIAFIDFLDNAAKENSLDHDISFDRGKKREGEIDQIPLAIKLSGRMEDIDNYLQKLEQSDFYVIFRSVTIKKREDLNKNGVFEATLDGFIYTG